MTRRGRGAVIVLLITLAVIRKTYACQCGVRLSPKEALGTSVAVFAGTVYDIRAVRFDSLRDRASVVLKEIHFTVGRVWRGDVVINRVLIAGVSDCDYTFERGRTYLVYADAVDPATGYLTASVCRPTKLIELAVEDLRVIGSGRRFAKPLFLPAPSRPPGLLFALGGAAVGAVAALTILGRWLLYRRRGCLTCGGP
jgi:hypothetical protein